MKLNLYEAITTLKVDKDICDNIFDYLNYFTCSKENEAYDNYDLLMIYFAKHIQVLSINDIAICCDISNFINKHKRVFDKFMNEENREQYTPKWFKKTFNQIVKIDDEEFYDLYMMTFSSLINGNYSDRQYKKLLDYLTTK